MDEERLSCELISIGNELLSGRTLNTNAQWLAEILTELGFDVVRCTVIRDVLEEIASSIRSSTERGTSWIITSGGLGPTHDDLTSEGLGLATGRELYVDKTVLKMLEKRYKVLERKGLIHDSKISPPRMKMAKIPLGAETLANPLGSAPGILLTYRDSVITCLPGVPDEMKAIVMKHVLPKLKKNSSKVFRLEATMKISGITESILAPLMDRVLREVENVYIKSHPMGFEDGKSRIDIEIISRSARRNSARRSIDMASLSLRREIREMGGQIIKLTNASKG